MNQNEITHKLDDIIVSLSEGGISTDELHEDVDLIVDVGFNSLTLIQCIVEIESSFGIEFDDQVLLIENIQSYSWLHNYIKQKCNC